MRTVAPGDVGLVDLFQNNGMADPMMVAVILQAIQRRDGMPLATRWVLVTDDRRLGDKAREFELPVWSSAELKLHMDAIAGSDV